MIGPVIQAFSILFGLRRAYGAFFWNERYRFTTWRSLVALDFALPFSASALVSASAITLGAVAL
ncbi:MAG TPA: hypothetical protein VF524_04800, partial [Polyangia bacterium]